MIPYRKQKVSIVVFDYEDSLSKSLCKFFDDCAKVELFLFAGGNTI